MYFNDGADGMIGFVRLESIPIFVHVSFSKMCGQESSLKFAPDEIRILL